MQALLENDSEDTPRELLELQEKFSARYKQQLEELKESHSREVARMKEESESSLKSLSEKYNLLEEQHQVCMCMGSFHYCMCLIALLVAYLSFF